MVKHEIRDCKIITNYIGTDHIDIIKSLMKSDTKKVLKHLRQFSSSFGVRTDKLTQKEYFFVTSGREYTSLEELSVAIKNKREK